MAYRALGLGMVSLLLGCFSEPENTSSSTEAATEGSTGSTVPGSGTSEMTTGISESAPLTTGATGVADTSGSSEVGTTTGPPPDPCVDEVVPGRLADVDVVMVVDGSSAIIDNAADIQGLLNDLSSSFPRNLRYRFILMSPVAGADPQFCVGPPLGAAVCGDPRFPHFVHLDVATGVPGNDPLSVLAMELNAGVSEVRAGSHKDLVVITDGDISTTPANAVAALRALGPEFANIRIHSVSGGGGGGCAADSNLSGAAELSFGTSTQLCPLEGVDALFEELLTPPPSCVFNIPDSDIEGAALSIGGADLQLEVVDSLRACSHDTPAASVESVDGDQGLVLCPATCAQYQAPMDLGELTVRVCE